MRFLLFMDWLREDALWVVLALLFCVAVILIWAPRTPKNWQRWSARALGVVLFCGVTLVSLTYVVIWKDSPREHFLLRSADGTKIALLSHSEFRDGAATEISVKDGGCCTLHTAYRYFGDGDDYVGAKSLVWVDDHHLAIRYVRDPSGVQDCRSHAGDVTILCEPQRDPFGGAKPSMR